MTLKQQLGSALETLGHFSSGGHDLAVDAPGLRLRCQLAALDSLACAFERLSLEVDALRGAPPDRLRQVAQRLASRLTYLLEPITPIETDAEGCVVQMRSCPPQKDGTETSYYELLVSRSGELSLCRYLLASGGRRQIIPAQVTREVLGRLTGDFEAAAL